MYFKIVIVFIISIYIDYMNSFSDIFKLSRIYMRYVRMIRNPDYIDLNGNIKSSGINKLSSICLHVIKNLRKEEEYKNMYVNYFSFKFHENQELCPDAKIWVPLLNDFIEAPACFCFGRSLVFSFERPEETLYYYRKLSFYPLNYYTIAVYELNLPDMYYTLLEIIEITTWKSIPNITDELFHTSVPISYSEIINLHIMLVPFIPQLRNPGSNENNIILYTSKDKMFPTICEIVLRPAKYGTEIIYRRSINSQNPIPNTVKAFFPRPDGNTTDLFISLQAYTCKGMVPGTLEPTEKYSVAAGPKPNSVIVLKKVTNYNNQNQEVSWSLTVNQQADITNYHDVRYIIIEYIEQLSVKYLHFYYYQLY